MSLLEELKEIALLQHDEDEFPEDLLAEILEMADHPERLAGREELVKELISQVRDYDPYAGSGCFSASFGIEDIRRTLHLLTS